MADWTLHNVEDVIVGPDIEPEPFMSEWLFGIVVFLVGVVLFCCGWDMGRHAGLASPACGQAAPTDYELPSRSL